MNLPTSEEERQKEAKKFQTRLFEFHQKIGSSVRRIPTLGGKELDVYHLYKKVESLGGYEVVHQSRLWGEVARSFNLPPSVTSASYAIRQHYVRLLEKFEACEKDPSYLTYLESSSKSSHPTVPANSALAPPTSTSWRSLFSPAANTGVPNMAASGPTPHTTQDRGKREGYGRLVQSLLSGFPNEVDFTFNVLTLVAFKTPSSFPVAEAPQLLDLMLAHVAVFPSDDHYDDLGLEDLYQCWDQCSDTNFLEFWFVSVPEWISANVLSSSLNTSPHLHDGLFASRECVTEWAVEGYRVAQLATILSNLSLISAHLSLLTSHAGVIKFLLLASHCSIPDVSSTAMDTLISLAPSISFPTPCPSPLAPPTYTCTLELLFHSMLDCIFSDDRMIILKGLSVLSQLIPNEDSVEHIRKGVWQRLFQLLLLPDIQLVLLSLDTLYQFTSQGSYVTAAAIFHQVSRCCEVLVSLLTLNVKGFGSEAMSKIRVLQVNRAPTTTGPSTSLSSKTTMSAAGRSKIGVTILNASRPNSNLASKSVTIPPKSQSLVTQTVKIGNCVIPVATSLSQGKNFLDKSPTILTVQQIQNLLAGKNISITPPTTTTPSSATPSSAVAISGGSNVTIHRGEATPGDQVSDHKDTAADGMNGLDLSKTSSSLLRSYLTKKSANGDHDTNPFTATNLPVKTNTLKTTCPVVPPQPNAPSSASPSRTPSPSLLSCGPAPSITRTPSPSMLSSGPAPSITRTPSPSMLSSGPAPSITRTPSPSLLSSGPALSITRTPSPSLLSSGPAPSITRTPSPSLSSAPSVSRTPSPSLSSVPSVSSTPNSNGPSSGTPIPSAPSNAPSPSILSSSRTPSPSPFNAPSSVTAPSIMTPSPSLPSTVPAQSKSPSPSSSPMPSSITTPTLETASSPRDNASSLPATPLTSKPEEFACQWLKSGYEESQGSYVSQLEIYSLYLLASTKAGVLNALTNTQFSALIRKEFPNSLSTRVSVGSQAVYMVAGLAKRRGHGGQGLRDAVTVLDSTPGQGGVVSQLTVKQARGALSTPVASTACQTSVASSRPDYSTQSPLAISSKAVKRLTNGTEEVELEGVAMAKRIKLNTEMEGDVLSKQSVVGVNYAVPHNDVTSQALTARLDKLLNKSQSLINKDRTPSPSLGLVSGSPPPSLDTSTRCSSPLNSRTISPLPVDTPTENGSRASPVQSDISSNSASHSSNITTSFSKSNISNAVQTSSDSAELDVTDIGITCQWGTCNSVCDGWNSLFRHAVYSHVLPLASLPLPCQWLNCTSKAKRNKSSLMAHLQACHCGGGHSLPNVQQTLARLKAVAPLETEVEDPLSKAIRLTAALVMRNLAQHLPEARRHLKGWEHELCQVALSGNEASTAIAECLHYLQT